MIDCFLILNILWFDCFCNSDFAAQLTLQVEQGAAVGGGVWRSLGDGQQEGSVSSQQAAHEAKERLLDLQLQLLLTPVDLIVVCQQELQRRLLLTGSTNCSDKKDGETTAKRPLDFNHETYKQPVFIHVCPWMFQHGNKKLNKSEKRLLMFYFMF